MQRLKGLPVNISIIVEIYFSFVDIAWEIFLKDKWVQEGAIVDKLSRLSLCWCKCIFMFCVGFFMILLMN